MLRTSSVTSVVGRCKAKGSVAGRRPTTGEVGAAGLVHSNLSQCKLRASQLYRRGGGGERERSDFRVHVATPNASVDVDKALEKELQENGFRSTRRTKLICTIGPATSGYEELEALASNGMNVARLNMCHGSREWHKEVIQRIRKLNHELGYSVAIMVDTEGSEVHIEDIVTPKQVKMNDKWTFTVRDLGRASQKAPPPPENGVALASFDEDSEDEGKPNVVAVSYDGFTEDVKAGDEILVDGGMVRFGVESVQGPDVIMSCTEPGLLLPRANMTFRREGRPVRARNSMLPTISAKDWVDIDFAIENKVDLIAISFVKTAETVHHLKSYLKSKCVALGQSFDESTGSEEMPTVTPGVVSKIESVDSLPNLDDIVKASDAVMVARGDLGSQIPLEDVPVVQQEITRVCRRLNKPCIVASHLLRSMLEHPTPTRAEVADIADVVNQRADALMLSGESAAGLHPMKSLDVLRTVATRTESFMQSYQDEQQSSTSDSLERLYNNSGDGTKISEHEYVSEGICASAAHLSNHLNASAVFVFTKRGYMASLLSRCRPSCPIFAFTDTDMVRRRMNLLWGIMPFRIDLFKDNPEATVERTFKLLRARGLIKAGELVIVVSDVGPTTDVIRSIQVRYVK